MNLYFMLADFGQHLAVGVGPRRSKRERCVKLAMAISLAALSRFSFSLAQSSVHANKMLHIARSALPSTMLPPPPPPSMNSLQAMLSPEARPVGFGVNLHLRRPAAEVLPSPSPPPAPPSSNPNARSSCDAVSDAAFSWSQAPGVSSSSSEQRYVSSTASQDMHVDGLKSIRTGYQALSAPFVTTPSSRAPLWCPTAFRIADGFDIDQSIIFKEGSAEGPYIAFGDIYCSERYLLWQAHVCTREFRRAPMNFSKFYEFPHMTLAKLEQGYAERRANRSVWFLDGISGPEEFDLSAVLRHLNDSLRADTTVYRLHDAHLVPNYYGGRYDITGGQARTVFRSVQRELRCKLGFAGDRVNFWAEEPAHPHITFEYPDEDVKCVEQAVEVVDEAAATDFSSRSMSSSMDVVLKSLDSHRIGHLKDIFEREQLSRSVLPTLTDNHLKEIGVKRLGDRSKVLMLANSFARDATAKRWQ